MLCDVLDDWSVCFAGVRHEIVSFRDTQGLGTG